MRLSPLLLLRTHDQHRAVGVANDRVRDAVHQGSPHAAEAPAAHDDEASSYVFRDLHDLISPMPSCYPQVILGDLAPILLDLLDLIFEDLLRLLPQLFDDLRLTDVVGGIAGRTVTMCSSELVLSVRSTAVLRASSASLEPSVAKRTLVEKMLISSPLPLGGEEWTPHGASTTSVLRSHQAA
jgi:hypothetical protein